MEYLASVPLSDCLLVCLSPTLSLYLSASRSCFRGYKTDCCASEWHCASASLGDRVWQMRFKSHVEYLQMVLRQHKTFTSWTERERSHEKKERWRWRERDSVVRLGAHSDIEARNMFSKQVPWMLSHDLLQPFSGTQQTTVKMSGARDTCTSTCFLLSSSARWLHARCFNQSHTWQRTSGGS